jgi:DNA-binding LacI/PurR family transcriptional regulator
MNKAAIQNISDIARLAGVSKSTVSRALNDSPLISEGTKKRIREIAEANDFAIHQGARSLSTQRTNTLAVVFPIAPAMGRLLTDPFNIEMFGAIANAMIPHGQDLLVAQVQEGSHHPVVHYLDSKRVDGLILSDCDMTMNPAEMSRLIQGQKAFIMWGPPAPDGQYCTVGSDDLQGGNLATQHLLDLGRREIAFISGPFGSTESTLRYQGYQQALHQARLKVTENLIVEGDYTTRAGYNGMKTLLQRFPTIDAVFAASDQMAMGAMQAAREMGRMIPDDLAVVGFDGTPMTAHTNPPLTTVRQDIQTAGRLLVDNLLRYIEDGKPTNIVLPVTLLPRQSTIG